MNEIENRKNFEEWLPDLSPMDSFIDKQGNFRYSDSLVQAAWCGYQAALSQQAMPEWQPISTAPKDGRPVLLDHCDWHSRVMRGGWDAHGLVWRVHGFGCPATQPTHWMPLPDKPVAVRQFDEKPLDTSGK